MADVGYILTRRAKRSVIVSRLVASVVDHSTGETTSTRETRPIRNVSIEPTSYKRLVESREAQTEIGAVTLLFYTRDIAAIGVGDVVIDGERRLVVVTSTVEETVIRVTAREQVGQS